MATTQELLAPQPTQKITDREVREITIYDHSTLMYWWPVWVAGYVFALMTYFQGHAFQFQDAQVIIHPSKNIGVIFTIISVLVIVMTHATVRGNASLTVIALILAATFLFAYLGWWDDIFRIMSHLAIFMNLGFYVFFSSAVFLVWFLAVFVFDRMTYWTFRPGQMIRQQWFGGGAQTYDTQGMSVTKMRDDLFRHWVLGMGSGDIYVNTSGANAEKFTLHNVMFVGAKLDVIEDLVAMKPDETTERVALTVGEPG